MIRHIIDDLETSSDDSDEEEIKATRLMFFEKAIVKMSFLKFYYLRKQL